MADLNVNSDVVQADGAVQPVKIAEEDHELLKDIQVHVDALAKYRQELGRMFQAMNNLKDQANEVEIQLANKRRDLAAKYDLEKIGLGQWAVNFENKEFVKLDSSAPIIP
jgi:hypothetical protein